jgi:hypothetical protein
MSIRPFADLANADADADELLNAVEAARVLGGPADAVAFEDEVHELTSDDVYDMTV